MPTEPADRGFDGLLSSAQRGDFNALANLFERCRPSLLARAEGMIRTALRSKADAADLVQDTYLEAQFAIRRFVGLTEDLFVSWLNRILDNNIADMGRKFNTKCRSLANEERLPTPMFQALHDSDPTPGTNAAKREIIDLIMAMRGQLSPDDQLIIHLRDVQGMRFFEIAEQTKKPSADAARKAYDRAIDELIEKVGLSGSGFA